MITISYWREKFKAILHLDDNPHRIAAAFSLGVFIACSPFIGTHFLSAFFLAWVLRLNPVAVILGTLLSNPWTFAPMFGASLWIGIQVYGRHTDLPPIHWQDLTVVNALPVLEPYLKPFLLGTTLLGIITCLIAYPCAFYFIREYRKIRHRSQEASHV